MPRQQLKHISGRASSGSTLVEIAPALFVFLCVLFFPLLDVVNAGAVYASAWYVNHLCTRELTVRRQAEGTGGLSGAGRVGDEVDRQFRNTGLARFIGLTSPDDSDNRIKHQVTFRNATGNGQPGTLTCTTRVTCRPFIYIPGLPKNIAFSFVSERPREETR